jgi:hypothetical protein
MKTVQRGWGRWPTSSGDLGPGVTAVATSVAEVLIVGNDLTPRRTRVAGRHRARRDPGADNRRGELRMDRHPLTDSDRVVWLGIGGQHGRWARYFGGGRPYSSGGLPSKAFQVQPLFLREGMIVLARIGETSLRLMPGAGSGVLANIPFTSHVVSSVIRPFACRSGGGDMYRGGGRS